MISKIVRTIVLFLFLVAVEIGIIFLLSVISTDNFLVKLVSCAFVKNSLLECNPAINVLTFVLVGSVSLLLAIVLANSPIFETHVEWKDDVKNRVARIQTAYSSTDPIRLKQGLIELDKLLDFTTRKMKIKGATYYDRVQIISKRLSQEEFKNIKKARLVRNKIIHEVGFETSNNELQKHIWNMRKIILKLVK